MNTELEYDYMTETPDEEELSVKYYEEKKELVSRVAYLCGVDEKYFGTDQQQFLIGIFRKFQLYDRALLIRSLCRLRTAIEVNFKKLNDAMFKEGRSFFALTEYYPKDALDFVEEKGIRLPTRTKQLTDVLCEINRTISDRINNCRDLLPTWIKWDYIKELFIMPNGQKREGTQAAANLFYDNKSFYPFSVWINWKPHNVGNLFANDFRFAQELYSWHKETFLDVSNLSDVSAEIKGRIYNFINQSHTVILVVDCENADPYSLCAMFNCIDDEQANKISKIILYDDPQAPSGWRFFEKHVNIQPEKIEHNMIKRILDNKSLLDVKLTSRVTREFYKHCVDSFVLVSSDSDFWGLIEELPDARFLVMLEHRKSSRELKKVLDESGIFYCYTDDFYTGLDNSLRMEAMLSEFNAFFDTHAFNVKELFEEVLTRTRVEMQDGEKSQFYDKYLRQLELKVEKNGDVRIQLKR